MSEKKKESTKPEVKPEPKTELPDTSHHYVKTEALKESATSLNNDALGAQAQS